MNVTNAQPSPRYRRWHGSDEPPDTRRELVAGPLRALLVGPDVRYVRVGDVEFVQRIYLAVRDAAWNTIPGRMEDLEVVQRQDGFVVRFRQRHVHGDIDFEWRGTIRGSADGTLEYEWEGEALSTFAHSKIGLNVHHPLPAYVGRPYRAVTPDGPIAGVLGPEIAPQLVVDGTLTGMFPYFDRLEVDIVSGGTVRYDFEGDYFEMQDQRNWADGNLKTYGTPLAMGFPMQVAQGTRLGQKMTVRYSGETREADPTSPVAVHVGSRRRARLPSIGLGTATHGNDLSEREATLLRLLQPAHLRADLHPRDAEYRDAWESAVRTARALTCPLEIAFFVTAEAESQAAELVAMVVAAGVGVARVLVFEEAEGYSAIRAASAPETVRAVREVLRRSGLPECHVAGGTNQFFNELNRSRPDTTGTDGVAFSLNPQVHAADDLSFADNLSALPDIAAFTHRICGAVAVHVTPVTLIGRNGPFPSGPPSDGGLPGAVDVRQASLLGAAWTAASVKGLAEGGADSITYYETTGWRGVIERESGGPAADQFPSQPGDAFPVFHVLADVAEWRDAALLDAPSDEPARAQALVVEDANGVHALLVNLVPDLVRVALGPLPGERVSIRVLDDTTAETAASDPETFRSRSAATIPLETATLNLVLSPHAIVRVDTTAGGQVG